MADPMNMSESAKAALKSTPENDVLDVSQKDRIIKTKTLGWDRVATKAEERWEYESAVTTLEVPIRGFPQDVCICFARALTREFGPINWGEATRFKAGVNATQDVPSGVFKLPGTEVQLVIRFSSGAIRFQFMNRDRHIVDWIAKLVQDEVDTNSVFRGKAIRLDDNGLGFFDTNGPLAKLVFNKKIVDFLKYQIEPLIVNPRLCRAKGWPLKYGVMLFGPYGCGKTSIALYLAKLCEANNTTFIYCKDPGSYDLAFKLLEHYPGSVFLGEDLDQIDANMLDLDNKLDGVDAKSLEAVFVFTTNHPETVQQKMPKLLRQGRIDDSILIPFPGPEERLALFQSYASCPLPKNMAKVIAATDGFNAAAIRHVIVTAEKYAVGAGEDLSLIHLELAAEIAQDYATTVAGFAPVDLEPKVDSAIRNLMREVVHGE